MNFKEYLSKHPEAANSELIEILSDKVAADLFPAFEEKTEAQIQKAERKLVGLNNRIIAELKQRSGEINQQMYDAEEDFQKQQARMMKRNLDQEAAIKELHLEAESLKKAKIFFYVSGGALFISTAYSVGRFIFWAWL